jgi:hypothetical protein
VTLYSVESGLITASGSKDFSVPSTNALTESLNNKPKDLVRLGSHYRFETIRAKALMAQFVEDKPKIIKDDFDF